MNCPICLQVMSTNTKNSFVCRNPFCPEYRRIVKHRLRKDTPILTSDTLIRRIAATFNRLFGRVKLT